MIEAPLLGDKFLDRNAPLAALARVPGVDDVAVDDFVERLAEPGRTCAMY